MPIFEQPGAHSSLSGLPESRHMRFFTLSDAAGLYAAAALAEHPDALELHLSVLRYGPATVRALRADVEELKALARRLGKTRILGLRVEPGLEIDPRWPKFTRLFGFTNQRVVQAAELSLE
ncbi:MAG: hypothetical protein RDU24_11920 [Humidesulfovibrio sp.]|uniref:hypothetical protein n=1 Tax=Humidesulfovibrio sp. TaxID=2910988 RepID=UPI0027F26892|nr:hypothetical protein [Humidesulfovibrio sp.]MDQ7836081.1 hypothetical protein [Humidesulfovibrio sp.]